MMRRPPHLPVLSALAALVAATQPAPAAPRPHAAAPAALVVIVGPATRLERLSLPDLRRLFLGERLVDDAGVHLFPVNHLARTATRVAFDEAALRMSPEQVGRYWIDRKLRGQGTPPRAFPSAESVRQIVAAVPGAVAYLRPSDLDPSVRAVRLDGRLAGDAGYPLALTGERP